jgi:hypothetical protein
MDLEKPPIPKISPEEQLELELENPHKKFFQETKEELEKRYMESKRPPRIIFYELYEEAGLWDDDYKRREELFSEFASTEFNAQGDPGIKNILSAKKGELRREEIKTQAQSTKEPSGNRKKDPRFGIEKSLPKGDR